MPSPDKNGNRIRAGEPPTAGPAPWWCRWNTRTACVFGSILLAWGISTSWQRNADFPVTDWRSDLRADAAGYYIYLPAAFQYGFRASAVDTALLFKAGYGFDLERTSDRIRTKYPYGTALLQTPFYLCGELAVGWGTTDGFTETHRRAIEAAAVFYWVLGLLLLGSALHKWRGPAGWAVVVVLLGISFGSNVFFYMARQAGYSHIYSFFAVCLALWALLTGDLADGPRWKRTVFHVACALILVIRSMDIIAVAGLYAWLYLERRAVLKDARFWVGQVVAGLLLAAPQAMYWKFAYGSWMIDSYAGESFKYWDSPHLLKELFSPKNGLVTYAPIMLLLPLGLMEVYRSQRHLAWLIPCVLGVLVYACASWWSWDFGCGFGCRPAVQYMPFVAFGVLPFLMRKEERWVRARFAILPILGLLVFVHYRAGMQVIPCFNGKHDWDWDWYAVNVVKAFIGSVP